VDVYQSSQLLAERSDLGLDGSDAALLQLLQIYLRAHFHVSASQLLSESGDPPVLCVPKAEIRKADDVYAL
jgi:hypothetical protein